LRRYREGDAAVPGFLDDYAFFVAALLDLYEADFNPQHLETAIGLTDQMRDLFEDTAGGGFFTTAEGDDSLLLRMKDDYDGAEPSGNAIALIDLLRLAQITNRADYHSAAESTLRALSRRILTQPPAVPQMLVALAYSLASKRQVVLAGDSGASLTKTLLRRLHDHFLPNSITLLIYSEDTRSKLASLIPVIGSMREVDGQPTAYVCRNYVCQLPTNEVSKFVELLQ
jgi:uncharacterized protein YyaL (SSP411 family)